MTDARRRRARTCRCWCPTSAAWTAPSSWAAGTSRSSGRATETFAQRNLNRSLDEQFAMFEPTVRRARDAGLDVRAYVSMCFGDPWEGDVPDRAGGLGAASGSSTSAPASSASATRSASAPPATSSSCSHGFVGAGMSVDQLAMHFHDTYGQALANAHSALRGGQSPPSTPAPAGSAAARTPRAPPATSPPRTWCGCCTASASRPASISSRSSPPASGWPGSSVGPVRRPWSGHWPRFRAPAAESTTWPMSSTSMWGRPRRGPPTSRIGSPSTAPRLARHDVRYPIGLKADMFRPALDLVQRSWGGVGSEVGGEWDALAKRVRRSKGTVLVSHEILAGATREQVERAMRSSLGSARSTSSSPPATSPGRCRRSGRSDSSTGRSIPYRRFLRQIQAPGSSCAVGPDVLAGAGTDRRARAVEPPPDARPGARRDRAAAGGPARRAVAALLPRRRASIRPGRPRTARAATPRSASRESRCSASSTAGSRRRPRAQRLRLARPPPGRARDPGADPDDERLRAAAAVPRLGRGGQRDLDASGWSARGVDVVGDLDDLRPVRPDPDEP